MSGTLSVTFTFGTSHHALWVEDMVRERQVPVEVVPAPPQAHGSCGLALRVAATDAPQVESACRGEGIAFMRHDGE
ncbi:MAG: putative Se/S carrier-like protein [Gemmatimonadota bacterium]